MRRGCEVRGYLDEQSLKQLEVRAILEDKAVSELVTQAIKEFLAKKNSR